VKQVITSTNKPEALKKPDFFGAAKKYEPAKKADDSRKLENATKSDDEKKTDAPKLDPFAASKKPVEASKKDEDVSKSAPVKKAENAKKPEVAKKPNAFAAFKKADAAGERKAEDVKVKNVKEPEKEVQTTATKQQAKPKEIPKEVRPVISFLAFIYSQAKSKKSRKVHEEDFQAEIIRLEKEKRRKKKGVKEAIESMKGTIIDLDVSSSDISVSGEIDILDDVCPNSPVT
jgi:hypothetical protein